MIGAATHKEENINTFRCDVSSKESIKEAANLSRQKFGDVTLLINNAGIVSGKSLLDVPDMMIQKTEEVNGLGVLWAVREFLPAMIARNKGHIVTISSVASMVATPILTEYCASKAYASMIDEGVRVEMHK